LVRTQGHSWRRKPHAARTVQVRCRRQAAHPRNTSPRRVRPGLLRARPLDGPLL
jgi:hypothetical protein